MSNNCPRCRVKKPEKVLSPNGLMICPCDICLCTCSMSVEHHNYRKAFEEHQYKTSGTKKRTFSELKEDVVPNLSEDLQDIFEKESLELPLNFTPKDQQLISCHLLPPTLQTPSNNNIKSILPSSSSVVTPSSLSTSPSSLLTPPQVLPAPIVGNSESSAVIQLPDNFSAIKDSICRLAMKRLLSKNAHKNEKELLNQVVKQFEELSIEVIKNVQLFLAYAPDIPEDHQLSDEQVDDLLDYLKINLPTSR